MFASSTTEELIHGFPVNNEYAGAIDYLAKGAGAAPAEQLAVHTILDLFNAFSEWSARHSVRVGLHVMEFSRILGHSERDAFRFGLCSCLHDIGKLNVPINLLEKPGRFSEEEREFIQLHVLTEFACLDYLKADNRELAKQVIRFHHENFDGTGYPDRLARSDIPEIAQIGRICDFFDAVHSSRPYRPVLGQAETLILMKENVNSFNPALFEAFVNGIDLINGRAAPLLH